MNCMYCQLVLNDPKTEREATVNDLFCQPCADELGKEGMQKLRNTMIGQQMLVYKAGSDMVKAVKSALPPWLARLLKEKEAAI